MNFLKIFVAAAVLAGAAACGGNDYTLASGTYAASNVVINSADDGCKIAADYQNGFNLTVNVSSGTITVTVKDDHTSETGTIDGSGFQSKTSKTGDVLPDDPNCVDNWTREVNGTLTANDNFNGTYIYTDEAAQDSSCSAEIAGGTLGASGSPCKSTFTFVAKPGT